MDMFKLDGKVAIVTGGAGYYGKPICSALAEAGAKVIIASRDVSKCRAFAASLEEQGWAASGMALDLSEESSITSFVAQVKQEFGKIDILVNNAVSREGFKDLEKLERVELEASQRINSTGLMLITKAVAEVACCAS